jgi:hypothetical protein
MRKNARLLRRKQRSIDARSMARSVVHQSPLVFNAIQRGMATRNMRIIEVHPAIVCAANGDGHIGSEFKWLPNAF